MVEFAPDSLGTTIGAAEASGPAPGGCVAPELLQPATTTSIRASAPNLAYPCRRLLREPIGTSSPVRDGGYSPENDREIVLSGSSHY